MVKAAPASPFIMREAKFLLQLLVVPLNAPAHHRRVDPRAQRHRRRQVAQPIVHRLWLALGPLEHEPFFLAYFAAFPVSMRRAHSDRGKARAQRRIAALAPAHRVPSTGRQLRSQLLHRDRLVTALTTQPRGWTALAGASRLRRQGRTLGRPHRSTRLNTDAILQSQLDEALAKVRVVAVPRIGQHHADGHARSLRLANLFERNLWLGRKLDLGRYARLLASLRIARPLLRQIQSPRNRHAALRRGERQAHRNLAVVLLTQLAAVLAL